MFISLELLHPLGGGLFHCKPLYNQGFLRFSGFYLGIGVFQYEMSLKEDCVSTMI